VAPIVIRRHLAAWGLAAKWTGFAMGFSIALAIGLVALPCLARAEDAVPAENSTILGAPDKSGYNLLNPTPDDQMRKFAPDRPTKGFSVRTVDAGHVEVELDTFNETYSRYLGVITHSIQTLDPNVRIGITNSTEFEIQFNGLQSSRSESYSGALVTQGTGFGDVVLRTKMNLFGNDDGPVGLAIIPYVKVPSSAPVISNGAVEGGLIVPLALRLPQDYLITLMTEVDALKDDLNHREANFVNLVGVSHPLPGIEGANAMVELFSSVGADRATSPIYTFDLGMNFRLDKHTFFDVGLNLGLNSAAPKVQIYTGISARF
jgi:Putative MetA-pathway of phenol degradation